MKKEYVYILVTAIVVLVMADKLRSLPGVSSLPTV